MQNFKSPYLSENIQDFWRRWHISLSTWFRDYVYIPLGGSKVDSSYRRSFNIIVTFVVSGFWHGANWTFVIWGALHSVFYFIQTYYSKYLKSINILPARIVPVFNIIITFIAVTFAWIFFRAESFSHAINYIAEIGSGSILVNPISYFKSIGSSIQPFIIIISLMYLSAFEISNRNASYSFQVGHFKKPLRTLLYGSLLLTLIFFRATNGSVDFIYKKSHFYKQEHRYSTRIDSIINTKPTTIFLGDSHSESIKHLDLSKNIGNLAFGADGIKEMYIKTLIMEKYNPDLEYVFISTEPQMFNNSISSNSTFLNKYLLKLNDPKDIYNKSKLNLLTEAIPLINDDYLRYYLNKIYVFFRNNNSK